MICFRICLVAGLAFAPLMHAQAADTLHHVHGLAYSADGRRLMVPSHHGLAIYSGGKWSKAPGPEHDYMGFAATRVRIYSSGHPEPASKLPNPFGLIRSGDGGKTWDRLGLEGESDFHLLAAGWNTNAVYVWNTERNSRMSASGLYFTLNDGFTWQRAAAEGLAGEARAIAVHPNDANTVSVATSNGIFLSRNAGESFAPLVRGSGGFGVFFDLDAEHVWYSTHDGQARLSRMALKGGPANIVPLPPMSKDAVAYIAQNPVNRAEYAIATLGRNVLISRDSGRTWMQIAERGRGK